MSRTPVKTLLSVPPAVTPVFNEIVNLPDTLARHDPPGAYLGSGGGTAHLLHEGWNASGSDRFESWLSEHLFTDPALKNNLLLYYTGITRVAKDILGEIVQGMFLNQTDIRETIDDLALHAEEVYEVLQRGEFGEIGAILTRTWSLNQAMDPGTNPPEVKAILARIESQIMGAKLLGAAGGGYLLLCTNSASASAKVRQVLEASPPNPLARFVDFEVSTQELQVTRS